MVKENCVCSPSSRQIVREERCEIVNTAFIVDLDDPVVYVRTMDYRNRPKNSISRRVPTILSIKLQPRRNLH